jgi:Uma2 family endonuclease
MALGLTEQELMQVMDQAQDAGIKLELHEGLPIWEFLPSPLHVIEAKRIERSVKPGGSGRGGCGCMAFQDMSVRFSDGSIRRPDISIFCETPPATQEATTIIPKVAVELVSPGSEVKDLELSPPFYLAYGVLDVIVFDPQTRAVTHFRRDGSRKLTSPTEIQLECGCAIVV